MKKKIIAGILLTIAATLIFLTPFFPLDEIIIGVIGAAFGVKELLE